MNKEIYFKGNSAESRKMPAPHVSSSNVVAVGGAATKIVSATGVELFESGVDQFSGPIFGGCRTTHACGQASASPGIATFTIDFTRLPV